MDINWTDEYSLHHKDLLFSFPFITSRPHWDQWLFHTLLSAHIVLYVLVCSVGFTRVDGMYDEEHANTVSLSVPQNVWRGRSAIREEEVDPLLRGRDRHHLLRGPQRLRPGAGRGRGDGESHLEERWCLLDGSQVESRSSPWSALTRRPLPSFLRTGCTRVWSCSTASATTSGSRTPPSSCSSTRRTCSRRRSRRVLSPSATQSMQVRHAAS